MIEVERLRRSSRGTRREVPADRPESETIRFETPNATPIPGLAFRVGAVDDPAERSADQLADRAMNSVARALGSVSPDREGDGQHHDQNFLAPIRRLSGSADIGPQGGPVTGARADALSRLQGRGNPLPAPIRAPMERAFHADFGSVRVHSGPAAVTLNRSMGARAFTVGNDVVLGEGKAESVEPRVLAHELAHVVQDSNAASSALRRSPVDDTPVVHRLLGFEVELRVPTLSRGEPNNLGTARGGPVPDPLIGTFFAGGRVNKAEMGKYKGIELESDHDSTMADLGQKYLDAIGTVDPEATQNATYNDLSNLEYKTPPLDELAAGSTAKFREQIATIDEHAKGLYDNRPREQMSNIPGAMQFQTGIPVPQIKAWLAKSRTSKSRNQALRALQDHIQWHMYVQATVGILPSGLGKLYESQAEALPESNSKTSRAGVTKDAASAVVKLARQFPRLPELVDIGLRGNARSGLVGLFTLAASYAIGRAMVKTSAISGSEKNAVSMFNKLSSNAGVTEAMPSTLKTLFDWDEYRPYLPALVKAAAALIHRAPQTTVEYWTGLGLEPKPDRASLYGGTTNAEAATATLINDWLTGIDTIAVYRTGEEGQLAKPDDAPVPIADWTITTGQRGIPLEYRWIFTYPSKPGELWQIVQGVIDEVRMANLHGLPIPDQRERILRAADTG